MSHLSPLQKEAIERAGYLLEQKIASKLKRVGFHAIPNYAFKDPEDGISREIDIFGISAESVGRRGEYDFIFPVLLVEVKNVGPVVCFTQNEITSRYIMGEVQISGIPKQIYKNDSVEDIAEFLNLEKFHHYYQKERIASQFCLLTEKSAGNWLATHKIGDNRDLYHEIVIPLVRGVVHEKREHEEDKSWYFNPTEEGINLQFYYPIFVVNELFECYVGGREPIYRKVNFVNFIRRYNSKNLSGEFRIDICTEAGFPKVVKIIKKETERIAKKIRRNRNRLLKSAYEEALEKAKIPGYLRPILRAYRNIRSR